VKAVLPAHAQDIYRAAFNSAWEQYDEPGERRDGASQEETAHKVAWSAVKGQYTKQGDTWVPNEQPSTMRRETGPPLTAAPLPTRWRSARPPVHATHTAAPHADAFLSSPGNSEFEAGVTAFVDLDDEAAVTHLDAAIAADPLIDEAHYVLGLALLRLGRTDEAVRALQHAAVTTRDQVLRDYALNKLAELGVGSRSDAFVPMAAH
jgi:cation transport regulator